MATNDLNIHIREESLVEGCSVPQPTRKARISGRPAPAPRLVRQGIGRALGSLAVMPIGLVASGIVPTAPFAPSVHQSTPMRALLSNVQPSHSYEAGLSSSVSSAATSQSSTNTLVGPSRTGPSGIASVTSSTTQNGAPGTSQGVLGPVTGFGTASNKEYGQPSSTLAAPVVAIVRTPDGGGYWLVGADGGVFAFGDATFHGSLANTRLARPIVAAIPTPDGGGYWLVGADGGVFAFGDATFHGSLANTNLARPIVAAIPTPDGGGYWLASTVIDAVRTSPARAVPASPTTAGRPLGSFVVTCYDLTGRTASGAFTSMATVAVDPSVIALGTKIYIQGVGYRYAQDTGGAIRGRRLDIWEPTYADCMSWGVRSAGVWAP